MFIIFESENCVKIHSLGYVFPDKFIGIFNASFLPVGMRCISSILVLRSTISHAVGYLT